MSALRPTGTIEEIVDELTEGDAETAADLSDPGDEWLEGIGSSAVSELDDRVEACGGEPGYPFRLGEQYLQCLPGAFRSVYVFLLLLAVDGVNAGRLILRRQNSLRTYRPPRRRTTSAARLATCSSTSSASRAGERFQASCRP